MAALEQFFSQAMLQPCAEMLIRLGLARRGRKTGVVAVAGDTQVITPFGEILAEMMPGVEVVYYGLQEGFGSAGTFDKIPFADVDLILVAHNDPNVEIAIAQLLHSQAPQGWGGALLPFGPLRHAFIGTLQKLPGYRGCLNLRKLAAVAAAVTFAPPGILVECGVYHGGTTVVIAKCLEQLGRTNPIYALDTFKGLPAPTAKDVDLGIHYPEGYFSESSYQKVTDYFRESGVSSRIQAIEGLVGDTLPAVIAKDSPVSFAFLDMDQYGGTIQACTLLRPVLAAGATILIDDVSIPGVNQALEEAVAELGFWRGPLTYNVDVLTIPG